MAAVFRQPPFLQKVQGNAKKPPFKNKVVRSKARADAEAITTGISATLVGTIANSTGISVATGISGNITSSEANAVATSSTSGVIAKILGTVAAVQATSITLGEANFLYSGVVSADGTSVSLAEAVAFWLTDTSSIAESTASADSGLTIPTAMAATGESVSNGIAEDAAILTHEQEGYRFRNDNGSESAATWYTTQDSDITEDKNVRLRLRVITRATGNPQAEQITLQVRAVGDTDWNNVPVDEP